jgi:hypothetical protein
MLSLSPVTKAVLLRLVLISGGLSFVLSAQPLPEHCRLDPVLAPLTATLAEQLSLRLETSKPPLRISRRSFSMPKDNQSMQAIPNSSGVVLAFNNLSVAHLRQRDFLTARLWVQQAIDLDPDSPAAIHNLANIEANLRGFAWPASPNGMYAQYVGCGEWNVIRIGDASASGVKLSFNGIRAGARGCHSVPAAIGELEGEAVVQAKSATYRGSGEMASCKIQLEFQTGSVSVEEDGECGFGAGVHTSDDYQRISVR